MRKLGLIFFVILFFNNLQAQDKDITDLKYLEDQVYLSLTYNILNDKPNAITQNGFSGGVSIGFIKDLPINDERNIGFGIGLGYAYNTYIQNLKITKQNQITVFEEAIDFKSNSLRISSLELPIELRWRNSTPSKYKFLRIYGGLKVSYLLLAKTKFTDLTEIETTKNVPEINRIQYGLILATGYSTWNLYVYYGLNPFFKNTDFNGERLKLKDINIGLKFYMM